MLSGPCCHNSQGMHNRAQTGDNHAPVLVRCGPDNSLRVIVSGALGRVGAYVHPQFRAWEQTALPSLDLSDDGCLDTEEPGREGEEVEASA